MLLPDDPLGSREDGGLDRGDAGWYVQDHGREKQTLLGGRVGPVVAKNISVAGHPGEGD